MCRQFFPYIALARSQIWFYIRKCELSYKNSNFCGINRWVVNPNVCGPIYHGRDRFTLLGEGRIYRGMWQNALKLLNRWAIFENINFLYPGSSLCLAAAREKLRNVIEKLHIKYQNLRILLQIFYRTFSEFFKTRENQNIFTWGSWAEPRLYCTFHKLCLYTLIFPWNLVDHSQDSIEESSLPENTK